MLDQPVTNQQIDHEEAIEARADIATYYKEQIRDHGRPFEGELVFDEQGNVYKDPMNKGFANDFTMLFGDAGHWEIKKVRDMFMLLAMIQAEHDELVVAFARDNESRTLVYKITLK